MIAIIIKAKVCVICRSQSLRQITQTEGLIIIYRYQGKHLLNNRKVIYNEEKCLGINIVSF